MSEPDHGASAIDFAVTGGLGEGAKLRASRMLQIVPGKGLRFLGTPNWDQFTELVRTWRAVRDTWDCGLADIVSLGVATFGQEPVTALFTQEEFDFADQRRAVQIGQLTLEQRAKSSLTSAHFYLLGGIEDAPARERWLAVAEKEKLTPLELQCSITAGKVLKGDKLAEARGSGGRVITLPGIAQWFEMWERQVGGEETIMSLPVDQRRLLLRDLEPQARLYLKLQAAESGVVA